MTATADTEQALLAARQGGDPNALARALVEHANHLIRWGHLYGASRSLDEAAAVHRDAGRAGDEAHCEHLAATLLRLQGRVDEASARAQRATTLSAPRSPERVAAWAELGEIGMARKDGPAAEAAFAEALREGSALLPLHRGALLYRRAEALALAGDALAAATELRRAREAFGDAGDGAAARRAHVREAAAWLAAGDAAQARGTSTEARTLAVAARDEHALADLELLAATLALAANDAAEAFLATQRARDHALCAVVPQSYVTAALTLSELAEHLGERGAAYEALAVGWVTLADLLGADAARETFAPRLLALRRRWGPIEFARIKRSYEMTRHAVGSNNSSTTRSASSPDP